jgi:hypothetical protein
MRTQLNINKFILPVVIIVSFAPACVFAATVGIVTNHQSVVVGQPFEVDVTLDAQGAVANAIQADVTFPSGSFTLQGVNDGSSPISLWIEPPHEVVSGTVEFSGIVPGGIGAASSVVGLVLVPTAPGLGAVGISGVTLLENDGLGTPIPVTTTGVTIDVAPAPANGIVPEGPSFSYTVPETFTPVISKNSALYSGEYFLVFSTTDKGSGMAYYEVLETPAGTGIGQNPAWIVATSPYLLQDQTLSSDIYVRAINNAGNSIIVKILARHRAAPWRGFDEAVIVGMVGVIVIAMAFLLRRRRRRRSHFAH